MNFLSMLAQDIRFQLRHGFYFAYLLISVLYIAILALMPSQMVKELASVLIIFSDPSTLGFFFIGGIILLEKDQQIYDPLFVTPMRVSEYLFSKLFSLSILALSSSILIKSMTFGFSYHVMNMVLGVFLTSLFFSLIGITIAAKSRSLNHFFLLSMLYTPLFCIPLLSTISLYDHILFYLIPTKASLVLIEGSFHQLEPLEYLYSITMLSFSILIAYKVAYKSFQKSIVLKIGG